MRQVFTFGFDHLNGRGGHRYAVVYGRDREHCRQLMAERFGREWAFQYDTEEQAGVDKWGLIHYATLNHPDDEDALRAEHDAIEGAKQ